MSLTMSELQDKIKSWAQLSESTQITKERVYVHRIWVKTGGTGDQFALFDGTGTTGKKLLFMQRVKDMTEVYEIGLLFNDGLYFQDISGNTTLAVSYTIAAD